MATTYTITNVNSKVGSIVITPSVITTNGLPEYFFNLKNIKLEGKNAFLADGTTLNPQASFSIFCFDQDKYIKKDMLLSTITTIGSSATPATLALALAAIGALIAE